MAAGQDNRQIQAGATAQPLVTSPEDIITSNAVAQLTDAFHRGVVNTDDVIQRIGEVGQANKKALLESLGEYVSPDAIKSRMAQITASGAQSNLAQSQAQAAQGLIQPATQLQQNTLATQNAATVQGPQGLQSFQQYSPFYGEHMDDYRNPDGTYDFQKAAQRGNQMYGEMNIANNWINQLTPASDQTVTGTDGGKYIQKLNKFGVNVTPPHPETGYPGSPAYWAYVKQLQQFLPSSHPMYGQFMMAPTGGKSDQPGIPTDSTVDPGGEMSPDALVSPKAVPAGLPAPAATVQSAAQGASIAPGQTTPEARKALEELPDVKKLAESQPIFSNFLSSAVAAKRLKPGEPSTISDLGLAETFAKLIDPTSTIREFKWEAIKSAIPWIDKFKDAKSLIEKQHTFPPDFRDALIKAGFDIIEHSEAAVAPRYQYAQTQAPGVLDSNELGIAKGIPFRQRMGYNALAASGPSASGSTPVTSPVTINGRTLYRGADGQIYAQ